MDYLSSTTARPLGTRARFVLAAATEQDSRALRGLGTYGFIRGAAGFIIGAVADGELNLEGFGCLMEEIVLFATDLDLGTCWLGGSFTRSSFAQKIAITGDESVPAVVSVGHIPEQPTRRDRLIRRGAGSHSRFPWEQVFFRGKLGAPLTREAAGAYAVPLDMVRLAPSASNKQPWRVVQDGNVWHFFLQRTPGYRKGGLKRFARMADLQRIDMGIAMSHFELSAGELGLGGRWVRLDPGLERPDERTEYTVSWVTG
jgi:nitroreductase